MESKLNSFLDLFKAKIKAKIQAIKIPTFSGSELALPVTTVINTYRAININSGTSPKKLPFFSTF